MLASVLDERRKLGEGLLVELARRLAVEVPICSAVDAVLNRAADIDAAIAGLLARPLRAETEPV